MLLLFIITAIIIALAIIGLAVGILVKGKFPDTHVGHNPNMKKLGITCAKNDSDLCRGRDKFDECKGCSFYQEDK
jgi:hypothetical protein